MKNIFYFIGTEAELIKVFPVIVECQKSGMICHIIASGQNDLKQSRNLHFIKLNGEFIELSQEKDIEKSAKGLLKWFLATKRNASAKIKDKFGESNLRGQYLVVHGDTVSTMMGALLGKRLGMIVCHVEAGLRSHHLFNPFPEEIDRLITSRIARVHFAPGQEPTSNLKKVKGTVINTTYNTILDSLLASRSISICTDGLENIINKDYFVFVMHRQENIMNKEFVKQVIGQIETISEKRKCVLILHKITENALIDLGLMDRLLNNSNMILIPRVDYFDFMKLLENAQYVITDGGSNQEELHYMGIPSLIMRKTTERQEGIGSNALMYDGNIESILNFSNRYLEFKGDTLVGKMSPSKMIADVLLSGEVK